LRHKEALMTLCQWLKTLFTKEPEDNPTHEPREETINDGPEEEDERIEEPGEGFSPWMYPHNDKFLKDPDVYTKLVTPGNSPLGCVIHHTVSSQISSTANYFASNAEDIHFLIGKAGEVYQMVPCNYQAAHAGTSLWDNKSSLNRYYLGIEMINMGPLFLHEGKYYDYYNRKTHAKEFKGEVRERKTQGYEYWEPFTEAQEAALTKLVQWTLETYRYSVENVIGHYECSPERKNDPAGGLSHGSMIAYREFLKKNSN